MKIKVNNKAEFAYVEQALADKIYKYDHKLRSCVFEFRKSLPCVIQLEEGKVSMTDDFNDAITFKEFLEQQKEPEYPFEEGREVYVLSSSGFVDYLEWGEVWYDEYHQGNVFATIEEAERESEKRKALFEFKRMAGGYECKNGVYNWYLFADCDGDFYAEYDLHTKHQGTIYFPSEESLKQAMEKLGEDKLKLIMEG